MWINGPHGFPSHSLMDPPAQISEYETATATLSLPATPPQTHGSGGPSQMWFQFGFTDLGVGCQISCLASGRESVAVH